MQIYIAKKNTKRKELKKLYLKINVSKTTNLEKLQFL